jgi:hypothetical protein
MKTTKQSFRPFKMGISIGDITSSNVSYWIEFIAENRDVFDVLTLMVV